MTLEVQNRTAADTLLLRILGAALVVGAVILGAAWLNGSFDAALAPYGLNVNTCVEMYNNGPTWSAGDYKCGDEIPPGFYSP